MSELDSISINGLNGEIIDFGNDIEACVDFLRYAGIIRLDIDAEEPFLDNDMGAEAFYPPNFQDAGNKLASFSPSDQNDRPRLESELQTAREAPQTIDEIEDSNNAVRDWITQGRPTTTAEAGKLVPTAAWTVYEHEETSEEVWTDELRQRMHTLTRAGFWPGKDVFAIKDKGNPTGRVQSADNAYRHGVQGIGDEDTLISLAFWEHRDGIKKPVVITHTGAMDFDEAKWTGQGSLEPMTEDELTEFGWEHGTVSPIGALIPRSQNSVSYYFDRSVVNQGRNMKYISGGEGFSIALDVQKLVGKNTGGFHVRSAMSSIDICTPRERRSVYPKANILLISGDSAFSGQQRGTELIDQIYELLADAGTKPTDALMPEIDIKSRSNMGGTANLDMYGSVVIDTIVRAISKHEHGQGKDTIIAMTSNAANTPDVINSVREGLLDTGLDRVRILDVNSMLVKEIEAMRQHAQDQVNDPENSLENASSRAVVVFGLPEVSNGYPEEIHTDSGMITIGRAKSGQLRNIQDFMNNARMQGDESHQVKMDSAREFVQIIKSTLKQRMAAEIALASGVSPEDNKAWGQAIGAFMRENKVDADCTFRGTVILAGTELADLLEFAKAQDPSIVEGLENVIFVDPIEKLMKIVAAEAYGRETAIDEVLESAA